MAVGHQPWAPAWASTLPPPAPTGPLVTNPPERPPGFSIHFHLSLGHHPPPPPLHPQDSQLSLPGVGVTGPGVTVGVTAWSMVRVPAWGLGPSPTRDPLLTEAVNQRLVTWAKPLSRIPRQSGCPAARIALTAVSASRNWLEHFLRVPSLVPRKLQSHPTSGSGCSDPSPEAATG